MRKKLEKEAHQYALALLRVALGWLFFYAGITKILGPGWRPKGFLLGQSQGLFKSMFVAMAGSAVVDWLVMLGLTLIGAALILGVLTRFASFWGIVMMVLFYLPTFPPEHGFVDEHIIYALVLAYFIAVKAGKYCGIDKYIEHSDMFWKHQKWLRYFFG